MAFMVLLLIGWVIWNNKPLPLPFHGDQALFCTWLLVNYLYYVLLPHNISAAEWPSGLRRCVQVAVSEGGAGSNPAPVTVSFHSTIAYNPGKRFAFLNEWETTDRLDHGRSLSPVTSVFKNSPFVNSALCDVHTVETNDLSWSCRSFHASDRFVLWITISGLLTKILVSERTLFMKKIFSINTVPVDF